jgi:hypothetical protein
MRALLTGLFLLWAAPVFSEESSPRPSERKTEATQTDNKNSGNPQQTSAPATPIPAPVINVYTAKHAGEESQCAQPKDWKEWPAFSWCKADVWLDAERIIAIFTVILGIATWLLWRATADLVRGAEEASQRQLRAYLSVTPFKVFNWVNPPNAVGINFVVKNHGQTPALEMASEFRLKCWINRQTSILFANKTTTILLSFREQNSQ